MKPQNLTALRTNFKAAVRTMVETIDKYFTFSALEILSMDGSESNFKFPKKWPQAIALLAPDLPILEEQAESYSRRLNEALSGNKSAAAALRELEDCFSNLQNARWHLGFYAGTFVGAKMMGASRDRLDQIGQGLIEVILAQPRFDK